MLNQGQRVGPKEPPKRYTSSENKTTGPAVANHIHASMDVRNGASIRLNPQEGQKLSASTSVCRLRFCPSTHSASALGMPVYAMAAVQNDLGSPGYAPIPSIDTDRADMHREDYVKARWGQ